MPIYEYECKKCKKVTEETHTIRKRPQEIECECGTVAVKIVSKSSFKLVGSCWMRDDYKYSDQIRK